ncbi:hypothetical protein A3B55_02565 [Candidatus Daviesbacteria bacterium RIFCSPLOWO2_01_FULL_43_15]|nr:MAG: hypothetical protein A3B55_02565 [Candidatus Daviesbacteria bacterium RIFCSPLOWO2_01_FULL_43_15]
MKYLLDTSVLVDHLRRKNRISDSLVGDGVGISIISYAELFHGAYRSANPEKNLRLIAGMVREVGLEVVGLDEKVVDRYAKIRVVLEKRGERLEDFDLLIGATAISENLILVTGNARHFKRISGLSLVES